MRIEEFNLEINGDLSASEAFDMIERKFMEEDKMKEDMSNSFCQWTLASNNSFLPASKTVKQIIPGVYVVEEPPNVGIIFKKLDVNIGDLIRFEDSICDEVVADIKKFWTLKEKYAKIKQVYKRGFLLHGVAGGGKTSITNLIIQDVINSGGVALKFDNPYTFAKGIQAFRKIEPDRPVVVLMEDIESIIDEYSESEVLNILDGINSIDNVVFLATTNYPDKLLGRVTNRPSRFDRVFELKAPGPDVRRVYLQSLVDKYATGNDTLVIDVEKWVKETKDLSIVHIKEIFISVAVFGYEYQKTLKTMIGMKRALKASEDSEEKKVGFGD